MSDARIIIEREDGQSFLIAKLRQMREGFALIAPYLGVSGGVACRMIVDYAAGRRFGVPEEDIQRFGAGTRVKLSYHLDGFAQSSAEAQGSIRSGRHETGEIKGVGVLSQPLTNPIASGPSCSVVAWGLDAFERPASPTRKRDLIFRPKEFIHARDPAAAGEPSYEVMIWVFPENARSHVIENAKGRFLDAALPPAAPMMLHRLKVPDFSDRRYLLGLNARTGRMNFGIESGWHLNGPSQLIDDRRGEALLAAYPALPGPAATQYRLHQGELNLLLSAQAVSVSTRPLQFAGVEKRPAKGRRIYDMHKLTAVP